MRDSIDYKCPKCGELLVLQRPKGLRIFKSVTTFTCPECGKEFEVDDIEFSDEIVSAAEEADAMSNDIAYSYAVRQFDDIDLNSTSDEEIGAYIEMFEDTLSNYNFKPEYRSKLLDMLSFLNWVINREDKAFEYVNESINEGGNEINSVMLACYYASQSELDVFDDARQLYNCLNGLSLFRQCPNGYLLAQDVYKDAFEKCKISYVNNFLSIPPEERRFIVFSDKFDVFPEDSFYVLPLNMVPKNLSIQGDPEENELYIRHPYRSNKYFLASDYSMGIFKDKLREFKKIMVNLGAKKISLVDTYDTRRTNKLDDKIDGKIKGNLAGKGSAHLNAEHQGLSEQEQQVLYEVKVLGEFPLMSSNYPEVPKDVVWLEHDDDWKDEVSYRLENGTERAKYSLTMNKSITVSKHTQNRIEAGLKTLVGEVEAEGYMEHNIFDSTNMMHSMEFSVEFYPLSAYQKE